MEELIAKLCDKVEELEAKADAIATGNLNWKNNTKLVKSEEYYLAVSVGIVTAISIACKIRDQKDN